ncbi:hypothetical protein BDR05DRAFT_87476 [Suillus weaverae]|nr:hypothetical protein BDR05DRAFT_87476 [Suillus weaverae]
MRRDVRVFTEIAKLGGRHGAFLDTRRWRWRWRWIDARPVDRLITRKWSRRSGCTRTLLNIGTLYLWSKHSSHDSLKGVLTLSASATVSPPRRPIACADGR